MKTFLSKIFFLCVFIFTIVLNAQNLTDQEMLGFYPDNIGNSWYYRWVYYNVELDYYEAGRDEIFISKDTLINNKKYNVFENRYGDSNYLNYFERIDSVTGDVLRIDEFYTEEHRVDNVYAGTGDTISISNNEYLLYCDKIVVLSIRDTVINNFQTTIREVIGLPNVRKLYFARNIGMLGSGPTYWIDSAKVNGILFSDISSPITDINGDNKTIATNFNLFQNYPNPFNPSTRIQYAVSSKQFVSFKVYDVLGNEIATLVNEEINPGNYEVEFSGSSLSSGIYYYQIKASDFVNTKKMILLR